MERVPTQTDLIRLCDAAEKLHDYYEKRVAESLGIVQDLDEKLAEIQRLIDVLPKPRYFFFSFDCLHLEHSPSVIPWQGWDEIHWKNFILLIEPCRELVMTWHEIKLDADEELKPLQRVGRMPGSKVETLIQRMKSAAVVMRSCCQFTPCEEQLDILSALDGKSRTAEELKDLLHISKSRLYGRREDKDSGGLNELMRLDLIRNGHKDGSGIAGYYRPERPPE